jgi:hypothetical protein
MIRGGVVLYKDGEYLWSHPYVYKNGEWKYAIPAMHNGT